ncbi:MAG: DUF4935 domain-containing protein [Gammaproteobacteria bacterium]|nr:DUF4935 domain-containing protein [Gammaproteobacteria bacterium]
MSYSIAELARMIISDEKDILLLDTCALLDIIRVPDRDNITPNVISSATNVSARNDIWLVASEIVDTEWKNNIDDVCAGTRNAIRNLHKKACMFKGALDHSEITDNWIYNKSVASFNLEEELKRISSLLLNQIILISNDRECLAKASYRVVNTVAPASKGKDEYKDCMIIEHYLELCEQLRASGFSKDIVFVSSNKSDFGSPYDIKEPLNTEFTSVQLKYVADLKQAEREVA